LTKKKAIVLIVEGPTDQMVLEPLNKYVDNHRFSIKVIGGDSYSDYLNQDTPPKNIVGKIMKSVMEETKFRQQDIALVLQLVDTDGAFITEPSFKVVNESQPIVGKTYCYDLTKKEVHLSNETSKNALINRWHKKGSHLRALCNGIHYSKVKIPYYLYFNSLNLEHVLGNQILNDDEKDLATLSFLNDIAYDVEKLNLFFKDKCPYQTYEQSWKEIFSDVDWHQSKSNISFLIDRIISTDQSNDQSLLS